MLFCFDSEQSNEAIILGEKKNHFLKYNEN